jgi:acetate kinase
MLFILRKIAEKTASAMEAADQLDAVIGKRAGLLGLSGLSNDMRTLRRAIEDGNPKARLAVDKFTWTIARWIGGFVAELGGLDMLVFTGGIGENDIATRTEVCSRLGGLGVILDRQRNQVRGPAVISADRSQVVVRVMPPAEDLVVVNHTVRLLAREANPTRPRTKIAFPAQRRDCSFQAR